jgi:DNA polymerase
MPTHLPISYPLQVLTKNLINCKACPLSDRKIIYRTNNKPIQLVLVGEAPGMVEYIQHKPFLGPAGEMLNALLQECVPPNVGYVIVNSISCTPWEDKNTKAKIRTPTTPEAKFCSNLHILPLIEQLKPKYVIALGKIAHSCLKKVPHLHVLHPSAILQSVHQELEFKRFVLLVKEYIQCQTK